MTHPSVRSIGPGRKHEVVLHSQPIIRVYGQLLDEWSPKIHSTTRATPL
jgi:hypothetical protein